MSTDVLTPTEEKRSPVPQGEVADAPPAAVAVSVPRRGPLQQLWHELTHHGSLLRYQFLAEFKTAHTGTLLGPLWWLLEPLLTMGIYVVLLGMILRAGRENYAIFILCGLLPWHVHAKTLSNGAAALVRSAGLIRSLKFPHAIMVLTPLLTNLLNGMVALALLAATMPLFYQPPSWHFLLAPLLLLSQSIFSAALAFWLSIANVYVRDVQKLLEPTLRIWYFLSPALFGLDQVRQHAPQLAPWMMLNPFATYLEAFRDVIMFHRQPNWGMLGLWTAVSLALFWLALRFFYRADKRIARLL